MTAEPRQIHGRKQLIAEKTLGVGDVNGEDAHADFTESAVAGDSDCRLWVGLHDALHPLLDVADEVAGDEM